MYLLNTLIYENSEFRAGIIVERGPTSIF